MSDNPNSATIQVDSTGTGQRLDAFARIAAAAARVGSYSELIEAALVEIVDVFSSPFGMIWARDGARVIEKTHAAQTADAVFWRKGLEPFLIECLREPKPRARILAPKQGTDRCALLAVPLFDRGGSTIGVLSLVADRAGDIDVARKLASLEALTRFLPHARASEPAGFSKSSAAPAPNKAWAHAGQYTTPEELAFAITNNLRNKLGCEQVSLGVVHRRCVRILSISGLDGVVVQSEGVRCLKAALEECLDAGQPICVQGAKSAFSPGDGHDGFRIHAQWRAASKGDAVASIPLCIQDRTVAVLGIRQRASESLTPERLEEIRGMVEPFAPALLLTQRASRTLTTHTVDTAGDAMRVLTQPGRGVVKAAVAIGVVFLLWLVFGTMNYSVNVTCKLVAAESRHVSAPFDGVLTEVVAIEGDRVRKGDLLCRFEYRELEQQRAELLAEIAMLERQKDKAMGEDSPVEFQLSLANQRLARARLTSLESRITRASVVAPIDGVVIAGDLRQRVDALFSKGEPLYEVAPQSGRTLELYVPEREVDDVRAGMGGEFAAAARPEQVQAFRIVRVRPHATVKSERNVYIAEAHADASLDWMMPGMEGIARIESDAKPAWRVLFHRVIDYVRMSLWL